MRSLIILVFCAAWAAIVPLARAQWICTITDSGNFSQSSGYYWYTALSCKGNNAVAAADVDTLGGDYLAFFVSRDGGISWSSGNRGLPAQTFDHRPIITSIDQIDSSNTIAFGDSDLLVRTTDAGATWQELTSPSKHFIEGISFADPMDGILVAADTAHGTYITTDGGVDWSPAPFTRYYGWQCHDYGNGMYRIFEVATGAVYTTRDNWNTVDSTGPIIMDTSAHEYVYVGCSFGESDTMFAHGYHFTSHGIYPYIAKSGDGGKQWVSVYTGDTTSAWYRGWVYSLSDISRDTIIAGLKQAQWNTVLWSTDHGETWSRDTLITPSNFIAGENFGIGFNSAGELLGAYSLSGADGPFLFDGRRSTAGINAQPMRSSDIELFPNPAVSSITLTGEAPGHVVKLVDILGREVLHGTIPASGTLTLDVSSLSHGLYYLSDGSTNTKFVKE